MKSFKEYIEESSNKLDAGKLEVYSIDITLKLANHNGQSVNLVDDIKYFFNVQDDINFTVVTSTVDKPKGKPQVYKLVAIIPKKITKDNVNNIKSQYAERYGEYFFKSCVIKTKKH